MLTQDLNLVRCCGHKGARAPPANKRRKVRVLLGADSTSNCEKIVSQAALELPMLRAIPVNDLERPVGGWPRAGGLLLRKSAEGQKHDKSESSLHSSCSALPQALPGLLQPLDPKWGRF